MSPSERRTLFHSSVLRDLHFRTPHLGVELFESMTPGTVAGGFWSLRNKKKSDALRLIKRCDLCAKSGDMMETQWELIWINGNITDLRWYLGLYEHVTWGISSQNSQFHGDLMVTDIYNPLECGSYPPLFRQSLQHFFPFPSQHNLANAPVDLSFNKWKILDLRSMEKNVYYLPHRIHGAAIYGNIYHQYTPNVSIYTIHGSYGYL